MNENIELIMPIKATPYEHQKKAFAYAMKIFGVFDEHRRSGFNDTGKEGDAMTPINKCGKGCALLMEM